MKKILQRWLGITTLAENVQDLYEEIYDRDAMANGFAVPKIQLKKTIEWAGKDKPVT